MSKVGLLCAAVVLWAASAPVAAQSPARTSAPSWLSRPTAQDIERVYPPGAFRVGMGGAARLTCRVANDGRLEECKALGEQPMNRGFGEAALKLASLFQMDPATRGATTTVTIPIRFAVTPPPAVAAAIKACVPDGASAPDWIGRPSGADIDHVYPPKAAALEKKGSVRLGCSVTIEGAVIDCKVIEEEPKAMGFGEAALKLAPLFRMSPLTRNCESVAGATVNIPLTFSIR